MKFPEALTAMQNGKSIRLSWWFKGLGIKIVGNDIRTTDGDLMNELCGTTLLSDKWEILQKEIEPNFPAVWSALLAGKKLTREDWTNYFICINDAGDKVVNLYGDSHEPLTPNGWIEKED